MQTTFKMIAKSIDPSIKAVLVRPSGRTRPSGNMRFTLANITKEWKMALMADLQKVLSSYYSKNLKIYK
jgi:hypothetical protein